MGGISSEEMQVDDTLSAISTHLWASCTRSDPPVPDQRARSALSVCGVSLNANGGAPWEVRERHVDARFQ